MISDLIYNSWIVISPESLLRVTMVTEMFACLLPGPGGCRESLTPGPGLCLLTRCREAVSGDARGRGRGSAATLLTS